MKPAACESVRESLSAYLEGELAPGPAGEVRDHLEGCRECRAELELLRLTVGALRRLPELPPPAGILAGVRARLRPEPWYRRLLDRRQWLLGVPVGAVATLLVVVGISFFQTRLPESERMGPPVVREQRRAPAPPIGPTPPAPTSAVTPPPSATAPSPAPVTPVTPVTPALRAPAPPPAAPRPEWRPRRATELAKRKELDREPLVPFAGDAAEAPAEISASSPRMPAADGERWSEAEAPAQLQDEAAAPSRFVIPEPAPERAASLDRSTADDLREKPRRLSPGRSAAIGALEAEPKSVSSLPTARPSAPERSGRAAGRSVGLPRVAAPASGPPAVRRAGGEFRMAGAPPTGDRDVPPGTVGLGPAEGAPPAPLEAAGAKAEAVVEARRRPQPDATLRMLLLLPADGGGINDLKRLLRREGAGEIEDRALEPRAVRDAFAPHRDRLGLAAAPSRGWSLRAEIPPRALARLLDALANSPGLRLLEMPDQQAGRGPAAAPLQLRITVLR